MCTGTGLFVGSGKALADGGPASLLLSFSIIGAMIFCTVQALGELAVIFPVSGSFSAYSTRFIDPAWGFAMGWNYAMMWLVILPLEIVAAAITIDYWGSRVSNAAWVAIYLLVIFGINLFGVRGYGEGEFVFSIIKVIAVVGFMSVNFSRAMTIRANRHIEYLVSFLILVADPVVVILEASYGSTPVPSIMASEASALALSPPLLLLVELSLLVLPRRKPSTLESLSLQP